MGYSSELFIQFQEAEYQETEIYQLKQELIMPAGSGQQVKTTQDDGSNS